MESICRKETVPIPSFPISILKLHFFWKSGSFISTKTANPSTTSSNYDNYDLLASVEQNEDKIGQLKGIINNLISYEPDKERIQEKYPVIQS